MKEIQTIFSYLGGSHAYGLNNKDSDVDERGIFVNTEPSKIYGLETHEHQENKETDTFYMELRKFLKLLQKGNTQATEALFVTDHILKTTDDFKYIQENKMQLLGSETLYKTLRGYIQGEKSLIIGHPLGKFLGEKRKTAITQYGYSYRNAVHAIRLLRCGILFFTTDKYPVNILREDLIFGDMMKDIKNNPQNHKVNDLLDLISTLEVTLNKAFEERSINHVFNMDCAVEICRRSYKKYL